MAKASTRIKVYLEIGKKRTFAGAIDWPGWCRSGPDEASALQALFDYEPRYARVLRAKEFAFRAPNDISAFKVIERIKGNATTDFGAPSLAPSTDAEPVNDADLQRFQAILKACWRFFDAQTRSASGKELRKGPRGGVGNWIASLSTFWVAIPVIFRGSAQRSNWMNRRSPARN